MMPRFLRKPRVWKVLLASPTLVALIAGIWLTARRRPQWLSWGGPAYDNIAELKTLPNRQVHLRGVVTYVDTGNHRFWMQDETGGIAVESVPPGIAPGQVVRVEARTAISDARVYGSPTVQTTDFQVTPTKQQSVLPAPKLSGIDRKSTRLNSSHLG